jgi:hypothetical protein
VRWEGIYVSHQGIVAIHNREVYGRTGATLRDDVSKLKLGEEGNMWVWNLRHVELVVVVRYKVQVCTIAGVERMYLSHETSVCLRKGRAQ